MSDVFDNNETDGHGGGFTPPADAQPADVGNDGHRDMDRLLAEFDTSEKSAGGSHKPTPEGKVAAQGGDLESIRAEQARLREALAAAPKGFYDSPELMGLALKTDALSAFTEAAMERVSAAEQQRAIEDRARLEQEDKTRVLAYAREQLDGYDVPEGWDTRWLAAEYAINAEVSTAWKNRYASEDTKAHAQHVVEQTIKRMVKDAKAHTQSRIDFNATEDRALVTAAVMGSSRAVPAEDGRAYSARVNRMTDGEFANEKERLFGG